MVELSRNSFTTSIVFNWLRHKSRSSSAHSQWVKHSYGLSYCSPLSSGSRLQLWHCDLLSPLYVCFARATTISTVPKPGAQWGKSTQRELGSSLLDGMMETPCHWLAVEGLTVVSTKSFFFLGIYLVLVVDAANYSLQCQ